MLPPVGKWAASTARTSRLKGEWNSGISRLHSCPHFGYALSTVAASVANPSSLVWLNQFCQQRSSEDPFMPPSLRPFMGAFPTKTCRQRRHLFASGRCSPVPCGLLALQRLVDQCQPALFGGQRLLVRRHHRRHHRAAVPLRPAKYGRAWSTLAHGPHAREVIASGMAANPWNAVICPTPGATPEVAGYSTPNWNELVIYEINVRTFLSDPAMQALDANGQHTGSFASIVTKLDYLRDLGVNAVEIMPVFQLISRLTPATNATCSPLKTPSAAPMALVLLSLPEPVNPALRSSSTSFTTTCEPRRHVGMYHRLGRGAQLWRHLLLQRLAPPDRMGRPARLRPRRSAAVHLRQRAPLAGAALRRRPPLGLGRLHPNVYDNNNDPAHDLPDGWSLCQWINGLIQQRDGWKISIAEDLKDNEWITKTVRAGGAGFNAQWEINFFWKLHNAMVAPDDSGRSMSDVAFAVGQTYNSEAFQRVIYTESHDGVDGSANPPMARVPEMIWPAHG